MKYKLGLFIGRFQPFHKGHEMIVKKALEQCDKLIILIGSAQESQTERNPFSIRTRELIISLCFLDELEENRVKILPIPDRENPKDDSSWGDYIISFLKSHNIEIPDVIFEGNEEIHDKWYETLGIKREIISRKGINISGTKLRQAIIDNDKNAWNTFKCSACDSKDFNYMRDILIYIKEKKNEGNGNERKA